VSFGGDDFDEILFNWSPRVCGHGRRVLGEAGAALFVDTRRSFRPRRRVFYVLARPKVDRLSVRGVRPKRSNDNDNVSYTGVVTHSRAVQTKTKLTKRV